MKSHSFYTIFSSKKTDGEINNFIRSLVLSIFLAWLHQLVSTAVSSLLSTENELQCVKKKKKCIFGFMVWITAYNFSMFVFCLFGFWGRVSLCSPGYHGTHSGWYTPGWKVLLTTRRKPCFLLFLKVFELLLLYLNFLFHKKKKKKNATIL